MQISSNYQSVELDFLIPYGAYSAAVISFYGSSEAQVRAFGAQLMKGNGYDLKRHHYGGKDAYDVRYLPINMTGRKDKFYHGIAINLDVGDNCFLCENNNNSLADALYNTLMERFAYPLLYEWRYELVSLFKRNLCESMLYGNHVYSEESLKGRFIEIGDKKIMLENLVCYTLHVNETSVEAVIKEGLERGKLRVTEKDQPITIQATNLDEYFNKYGKTLVGNLERTLKPISELNGEMNSICFNSMRLFPQQASMVNGLTALLKQSNYGLVICGMGTGKTIMDAGVCENVYTERLLKKGYTLKQIYENPELVNYRHIVMCPGHLVEKWYAEILREVPYAKVVIITRFEQLLEIKKNGRERNGREYFIVSKDFLKLSYQEVPTPTKIRRRHVSYKRCVKCDLSMDTVCKSCGSSEYKLVRSGHKDEGLCCPKCNELLFRQGEKLERLEDGDEIFPLNVSDFQDKTQSNSYCYYCGEELWQPYVKNIGADGLEKESSKWYRATFYANKAKKAKKTIWVLKEHEDIAKMQYGEMLSSYEEREGGVRKYSPALYIKKQLKGYFDIFVADEVHKCKGGSTAQGNAFHCIAKAAAKTLALTGTVAGGVASDLFYLLYRLDARRMKQMGYQWTDVMKFAEDYGTVERQFSYSPSTYNGGAYNKMSRGRQLSSPKVKPGISPKIFTDFLLDKAVFLDITDMSSQLPPLVEKVVLSEPETDEERKMVFYYNQCVRNLKELAKETGNDCIMALKNVFEMSYLDKPYGMSALIHQRTGDVVLTPKSHDEFSKDTLLKKEEDLLTYMEEELSQGRNCVVFCEYTGNEETCVTGRIRTIVKNRFGFSDREVVVMESSSPAAQKREQWIHKKAEEGMKVLICNPRCVETGIDFIWYGKGGKEYNYPSLFFYQLSTSLFVIWQASCRHYRINQKRECHTYYMGVANTKQAALIQLIAEKQSAVSAIQGKFSAEGLSAMAQGIDVETRLAQIMANLDDVTENKLQNMFDVIAAREEGEDEYSKYERMKIFDEVVTKVAKPKEAFNPFAIFESFSTIESMDNFAAFAAFDLFGLNEKSAEETKSKTKKTKSKPAVLGGSLFELIAN